MDLYQLQGDPHMTVVILSLIIEGNIRDGSRSASWETHMTTVNLLFDDREDYEEWI